MNLIRGKLFNGGCTVKKKTFYWIHHDSTKLFTSL